MFSTLKHTLYLHPLRLLTPSSRLALTVLSLSTLFFPVVLRSSLGRLSATSQRLHHRLLNVGNNCTVANCVRNIFRYDSPVTSPADVWGYGREGITLSHLPVPRREAGYTFPLLFRIYSAKVLADHEVINLCGKLGVFLMFLYVLKQTLERLKQAAHIPYQNSSRCSLRRSVLGYGQLMTYWMSEPSPYNEVSDILCNNTVLPWATDERTSSPAHRVV